ncbi:MAG: hypothetical protein HRT87_06225 [Legionellales bacterium]|nr:hypothetical protein [Legionellales bacterium]
MNITLSIWARRAENVAEMQYLFEGAIGYIHDVFKDYENEKIVTNGQYAIYNSNNLQHCWTVPVFLQRNDTIISLSEPLICQDQYIETEQQYIDFVFDATKDRQKFSRIFPKYLVTRVSKEGMLSFSDMHGIGRSYIVSNSKFVAVSNHIGILAYFIDNNLEINDHGWHLNSMLAHFCGNTTAFNSINRLGPGVLINCKPNSVKIDNWFNIGDLVSPSNASYEPNKIVSEWSFVINNSSRFMKVKPTVHLSGGRDSRVIAAAFLQAKQPCKIYTDGTIQGEADVAIQLMNIFADGKELEEFGIEHQVASRTKTSNTQSFEERIKRSLLGLDGDQSTTRASYNYSLGMTYKVTISGEGGEIAKGLYYNQPHKYDILLEKNINPINLAVDRYIVDDCVTPRGLSITEFFIQDFYQHCISLGLDDFTMQDFFFYFEKFRRWVGGDLKQNALALYASPAYVRQAFNASADQKRFSEVQLGLVKELIPQWYDIPFYGYYEADTIALNEKKMRIWQTDREFVEDIIYNGKIYPAYFNKKHVLSYYNECINGEPLDFVEDFLRRVVTTEMLWKHYSQLAHRVYKHRMGSKINLDFTSLNDEDEISNNLYETAEELWKQKKYKEAVPIYQQNYMMYKHAYSAYKCGVAYFEGHSIQKNVNVSASYMFIDGLDDNRWAIHYRGMILINREYNYYNLDKGIEYLKLAEKMGVKKSKEVLQEINDDN